ncbi:hypothetical protein CWR48_09235 [Oceanobacillus arenosus]|uniref:DUF2157 domain-containing protein n=1 Tax=Oceanobacillus arenosus TaxID=1229153 RepID=A0A3D8PSW2_9BACI|nr:hypothetical protein [Oceanobacillus arenosus]RDW19216.1 hypothetical protein CWR48_09235 [Oceanobacillus arenosus]
MADNERIAIIVNEVKYWKAHKLLPAAQCDFLLALYTNGANITEEQEIFTDNKKRVNLNLIIQGILLILLLPSSFLVLYFTKFQPGLQLGILILFLSFAAWAFGSRRKTKGFIQQLAIVIGLFIVLLLAVFLSDLFFSNQPILQYVIPLNFVGWFMIGRKLRIQYLTITSVFLLFFSIIYFTL